MDRKIFDDEFSRLLLNADNLLTNHDSSEEIPNSHGWFRWELELWNLGEQIRQVLLLHRKPLNTEQARAILNICLDPHAGKGRQNFVLLLGKTAYAPLSGQLAGLLTDPDVNGQVINTLCKMKAPGYADQIRPFLAHSQTWIRNEAQRYLQKYD